MNEPVKSILELRGTPIIRTGVNPIDDLKRFAQASERMRQGANEAVEKARFANSKWIDISEPTKTEARLAQGNPKGQLPLKNIRIPDSEILYFDFKVTPAGTDEWTVAEGDLLFMGQGTNVTVAESTVSGAEGKIYLRVTRDPSSRAASSPTYGIEATVPASTQEFQYFEIAAVGGDPLVNQKQFTPIRIYEDLIVVNGEFKYGNLAILGDNLYDLPA